MDPDTLTNSISRALREVSGGLPVGHIRTMEEVSDLRNMIIRQGTTLTLVGVLIGTGGAVWLPQFLASFLSE